MATLMKGEIVNQMFVLMRISGLTTNASPEDTTIALSILERMVLSYENNGLFLAYNKSEHYPTPDPSEESGIRDHDIQAVTLLLFKNVCPAFGKIFPAELREESDTAYRGLFSPVPPTTVQNPRQPAGAGQYGYCYSGRYYNAYMPTEERLSVTSDGQLEDLTINESRSNGFNL